MKLFFSKNICLLLSIFISLNIVFLPYTLNFFIGNHDWDWVKGTTQVLSLTTGLFEARFAKFILNVLLFSGHIFPILNNIVSFFLLSFGIVLLTNYWNIKNTKHQFLISLFIALQPFILGWLYFPINILGNFSIIPLVTGGLILSEQNKIFFNLLAILFFELALGVYPSGVETILIVFSFKHIINQAENKTILRSFTIVLLSIVLFKVLLLVLTHYNLIVSDYYNLKTSTLSYIISNIGQYAKIFFEQFYVTTPFVSISLKITSLIIVILALISSFNTKKNAVLWAICLASTMLSVVLTPNIEDVAFQPRINFYGLGFLYLGSCAVLLVNSKTMLKNIGYVLSILYIIISINNDLYAQKVWELGKTAETNLVLRMVKRIEDNSTTLPLIPVLTDEISLRPRYYNENYDKNSPYLLERSFVVRHIPSGMFNFYLPQNLFYTTSQISTISPKLYQYLISTTSIWPEKNSIYIDDKYAIIISTPKGLNAIKQQLPK